MPNNAIRSLFVDSRGLLWIGTENGIAKMENNVFQNFDESDGLAFNSCWAITEDPLGHMWFGSYGGGISMFDGQSFYAFDSQDGLINDFVRSIFYFDNRIWVGTLDGISAIDIHTHEILSIEKSILSSPQAYVSGFFTHEEILYYTTHGEGVYIIISTDKGSFSTKKVNDHKEILYSEQIADTILLSDRGSVQLMATNELVKGRAAETSFGQSTIWDYEHDMQGKLYAAAWGIFSKDGGIYQLEENRMVDRSAAFGVDSKVILALAYDPKRNVLYAGSNDQGLYAITLAESIMYEHFGGRLVMGFGHIASTTAVLHDQGLTLLDSAGGEVTRVRLEDFKKVQAAYVQKNGNNLPQHKDGFFELDFGLAASDMDFYEIIQTDSSFWISSNIGIYELDLKGRFLSYLPVHTFVMGFTPDGRFMDSNPYHGMRIYEDPRNMLYKYYSDTFSYTPIFLSRMVTSPHKTYFSSVFRGLYELDLKGRFLSYLPVHTFVMGFTPDGRFMDSNPYHGMRIYEDPRNMLYKYYSDTFSYTPIFLSRMVTSPHKTYFSSVFRGLYEWKEGVFLNYLDEDIWEEEKIKALHLMDEYTLAIGSEFGDFFIAEDRDGFRIKETISKGAIEGNSVQFLESWQGHLLIGNEKGLTVYKNGKIRFFDEEQGFESKLFQSAKVIGDMLWLGTQVGYYKVDLPVLLNQKDFPLELRITQLEVNHQSFAPSGFSWFSFQEKEIEVPHQQNTIYLSFKPTGHQFPEKLQYRYRLKPEDSWNPISKETALSLPYLPAGVYPVEVEVMDRHTGITRVFPLLEIKVKAAFYQRASFWIILFVVFLAVAAWAYKARVAHLRRKERAKSENVRRLAETKMEALRSQMNPHFIFNALNSLQYFILKSDTDGALDFMAKFSNLIRGTLDNSPKSSITLREEVNYLKAYFAIENARMNNRVQLDISIAPDLDPDKVWVPPMLLQPFVENSFIHAFSDSHPEPRIFIEFKLEGQQLHCSLADNGSGLQDSPATKTHESKGLKLVKERLKLMDGAVEEPLNIRYSRSGTMVRVILPLLAPCSETDIRPNKTPIY